jgi:hypothetical protein
MRAFAIGLLSVLVAACVAPTATAQTNPRSTSTLTINGRKVSVEYGRPSLRGRSTDVLLGKMPPGAVWRLGSDTSTTFKTQLDLAFGDVTVPAGIYSLWMQRIGDDSWKLIFNKEHGQGGLQYDAREDLVSASLTQSKTVKSVELVTILLHKVDDGGTLTIQWGTLEAVADFKVK